MSQYSPKIIKFCPFCGSRLEKAELADIGEHLYGRGFSKCQACAKVFRIMGPTIEPSSTAPRRA